MADVNDDSHEGFPADGGQSVTVRRPGVDVEHYRRREKVATTWMLWRERDSDVTLSVVMNHERSERVLQSSKLLISNTLSGN